MLDLFLQIADWLFPCTCELCGEKTGDRTYLCADCERKFEKPQRPLCFRCGEPLGGAVAEEGSCPHCKGQEHFYDFSRSVYINTGCARDLVLELKYRHKIYLGRTLGAKLAGLWDEYHDVLHGTEWVLVPVPMHPSKRKQRGYNQAEELAHGLRRIKKLPLVHALKRQRNKFSQTRLSREERFDHVRHLYSITPSCVKSGVLKGKRILLIDDVVTTGSTAEVCARELKKAGALQVGVLSVLRSYMLFTDKRA